MLRKRIIAALFVLPFFGVWAAFGIAPQTVTDPIATRPVTFTVDLPQASRAIASPHADTAPVVTVDTVRSGDTLSDLLSRLGVDLQDVHAFVREDPRARELLHLPVGRVFTVRVGQDGQFESLRVRRDVESALEIRRGTSGLYSTLLPAQFSKQLQMRTGTIRSSLFGATDDAGVPDAIAVQLVKLFSTDIDFHEDLRKGDRFSLVYEQYYDGAEVVKAGRLLAAEFSNQGRIFRAVYFETQPGIGDYFTPDGQNLRKAFLRSPVEFSRVSSGFTLARLHPILQTWRAHKGVDFAAPQGAPIIATADGIVDFAGAKGGYGNVIELRHHQQYSTLYGHLSRFREGLKKGAKVEQGEVIGYVGSTGWATGPHLHYEFRSNGAHQDPLSVALPQALPIPVRERERFAGETAPMLSNLALVSGVKQLARFE